MSDTEKDLQAGQKQWVALDISALENVGKDDFRKKTEALPDFELFRTLYDDPGMTDKEGFNLLHGAGGQPGTEALSPGDQFKPMDTDGRDRDGSAAPVADAPEPEIVDPPGADPDSVSDSQEDPSAAPDLFELVEQAKKEGYDRGVELGQKQGYDQGFEQGRAEGDKQGYSQGFERGENEARALQDEKAQALIASLETMLLKTEGTWEELVKRYEGKMIALIGRIAEKVVQARVKVDRGVVRASIIHALELLPEPEEIVLQVSEEDYEYIDMVKEDFFEQIKSLTAISVVANSGVKRGGCRIESRTARVETDVESRLQAVLDAVLEQGAP